MKENIETLSNKKDNLSKEEIEEVNEIIKSLKDMQRDIAIREMLFKILFEKTEHSDFLELLDNLLKAISKMDMTRKKLREDTILRLFQLVNEEQDKLDKGKF